MLARAKFKLILIELTYGLVGASPSLRIRIRRAVIANGNFTN